MRRFALLFALFLAACDAPLLSSPTPTPICIQVAQPFFAQLQSLAREWDDANKLAGQTPRAALAQQIQNLQAIRRKVQDLQPPPCAVTAHQDLAGSMDAAVDAYLAFLGQKPDTEVQAAFQKASTLMDAFTKDIAAMSPTVMPTP